MKTTTNRYQGQAREPTKPTKVRILQLPETWMICKLRAVEATADLAPPGDPTKKL